MSVRVLISVVAVWLCGLMLRGNTLGQEAVSPSLGMDSVTTVIGDAKFQHPAGLRLRCVAAEPLVKWPISADLALDGSLFVTESSGSNAPVQEQLAEPTHRVVRLSDENGDGEYDRRQVFAEKMMFPEGILCIDHGVLVAAPPQIWKLQDFDGDGVAEVREVWFDGQTLTGCANDLHGPYRGRDGLIYWCKGAFAEQTHPLAGGRTLTTTASHIFRRALDGGAIESVMTGGMDNPVEVAFDPQGNIYFTCTFIQHPAGGRRDGLVHAVYGGVYGKDHGVISNHPRSGELMPVMTHLGPAAPSGVMSIENDVLGKEMYGALVVSHFNLQKVSLHQLKSDQSGFVTKDMDLLRSERLDFHPTDVLHDKDGSLLVIDTGGWYRLCCPTSHLDQSAAAGGIYRIEAADGARGKIDWLGDAIPWGTLDTLELLQLAGDERIVASDKAATELIRRGEIVLDSFQNALSGERFSQRQKMKLLWVLSRFKFGAALDVVRQSLNSSDTHIRQTALQILGLKRASNVTLLGWSEGKITDPSELRLGLQWLGRALTVGNGPDRQSTIELLAKLPDVHEDRLLEHALIYAVIEAGDVELAMALLDSSHNFPAFCKALHALKPDRLDFQRIFALLKESKKGSSASSYAKTTALWLISRSDGWDGPLVENLSEVLTAGLESTEKEFLALVGLCLSKPAVSDALAALVAETTNARLRQAALGAMIQLPLRDLSPSWVQTLIEVGKQARTNSDLATSLTLLRRNKLADEQTQPVADWLSSLLMARGDENLLQVEVLATFPSGKHSITDVEFARLSDKLGSDVTVADRGLALEALRRGVLSSEQRLMLAAQMEQLGPMEISAVLSIVEGDQRSELTHQIVESLLRSEVTASMPMDRFQRHFAMHPIADRESAIDRLAKRIDSSLEERQTKLATLLGQLQKGDPLRGLQVFHGSKASCGACHEIGYRGGNIGPDLSRIGSIRSRRDLLEAILYPSTSFVRSYEPVMVQTQDGEVISGLLTEENADGITIILAADQRRRVATADIEEIRPSKTSVMPGGLEQVLSLQELSDLISLLETSR